jgi:GMP synthase-like glutamine amidotransferase
MLNIHYFMHAPFEGLAYIEKWVEEKGHKLSVTKFYENSLLPELEKIDWLIIMGGPMGVKEEDKFPWLKTEKEFIKNAVNIGKVVVGVCLGSQLIADVLGAKVYNNEFKEIGWFPIKVTKEAKKINLFSHLPDKLTVFHWHSETFDLPEGAILIAENEACKNQGFIYNEKVLGFQFHFEMTEQSIEGMLNGDDDELIPGKFVQTVSEIKKSKNFIKNSNKNLKLILDKLEESYK